MYEPAPSSSAIGDPAAPPAGVSRTRRLAAVAMMAAVIAVSAWIALPFFPVPLTLQTLTVLVCGGLLGPFWGPLAVVLYLALGAVGMPVFHGGSSGFGVLVGPTGGYLVGFVAAAVVMGLAAEVALRRGRGRADRRPALAPLIAGAVLATAVIYALGVPWLAAVQGLSLDRAALVGIVPTLPGDVLKAGLAVAVVRAVAPNLPAGLR